MLKAILALPVIYRAPWMLRDIQVMSTERSERDVGSGEGPDPEIAAATAGRLILRKRLADCLRRRAPSMHRPAIYGT